MTRPFGNPDGSRGPLDSDTSRFITLSPRFGAIGQPIDKYTRTRVVVGSQGVGKTLFLRRMHDHFSRDASVDSAEPILETSELSTIDVVRFSQIFTKSTNSQHWSRIWMRAIQLSAARHLLHDSAKHGAATRTVLDDLKKTTDKLLPYADLISAVDIAAFLIRGIEGRSDYEHFDALPDYITLRERLKVAFIHSRELYLFLDAIDDNFRHAPAYWMQCQRGLFYAVMNLMRTGVVNDKLHVVISIRDLVYSSILRSEHGARYMNDEAIVALRWNQDSCTSFLISKLATLNSQYFRDPDSRSIVSFLGRKTIWNCEREISEPIDQYLIRHTRLCPRDIIQIGNIIISTALEASVQPHALTDEQLRLAVALSSQVSTKGVLAQVANQIVTNSMPWSSSRSEMVESYTENDEYTADGITREVLSILLSAKSEVFNRETRKEIDLEAQRRFGPNSYFSDVLWQNRLVGYFRRPDQTCFYSGARAEDTELPDAERYVLNPILLDRLPTLAVEKGVVHFPGGEP